MGNEAPEVLPKNMFISQQVCDIAFEAGTLAVAEQFNRNRHSLIDYSKGEPLDQQAISTSALYDNLAAILKQNQILGKQVLGYISFRANNTAMGDAFTALHYRLYGEIMKAKQIRDDIEHELRSIHFKRKKSDHRKSRWAWDYEEIEPSYTKAKQDLQIALQQYNTFLVLYSDRVFAYGTVFLGGNEHDTFQNNSEDAQCIADAFFNLKVNRNRN